MKAKVQYDDVLGSAAADVSDSYNNSLQDYLCMTYKSYNGDDFYCEGCQIYIGQSNRANVCFICRDKKDGVLKLFSPEDAIPLEEAFNLFKRFEIVVGNEIENMEIDNDNVTYLN